MANQNETFRSGPLLPFAIYTIRRSGDLDDIFAGGGAGQFTEYKKWTTALSLFDQAKRAAKHLPIIFAGGEWIDGLIYWAVITDLSSSGGSTNYRFTGLRRLDPKPPLSSLMLRSTGAPLSDKFIRPYAIVQTPDYIQNLSDQLEPRSNYVAYHSSKVMGREYGGPSRRFRFLSRKPEGYLRRAIGCRAWVVASTQSGSRSSYWLAGMFTPSVISAEKDYFVISGAGLPFDPQIEVTLRPWFRELFREQGHFRSGFNRIRNPDIVAELDHLLDQRDDGTFVQPDEVAAPSQYFEGATRKVSVNRYERNPNARAKCIKHYGWGCSVCGFDFGRVYGDLGIGFIQVHHLKPLAEIRAEYEIDPIADLRPICPNCHAMIHSGKSMMSIAELKKLIRGRGRLS